MATYNVELRTKGATDFSNGDVFYPKTTWDNVLNKPTFLGSLTDFGVTATATELNVLDGIPSTLTATELGYVDGVTSGIQTQLNAKQATITGAATSITSSNLTASRVLVSDSSGKVSANTVTTTTLSYLDATSSIQTQLNAKTTAIVAYNFTQSAAATTTTPTAYKTFVLPHSGYYQVDIYGMWSKVAGSTNAPVITIAVNSTTGTPTWAGAFEWFNTAAGTTYVTENNSASITTTTTTLGFQPNNTASAVTSTYWGMRGMIYTGTTADKTFTIYLANSVGSSSAVYIDKVVITAIKVG